jgi:hypothetical protein
MSDKKLPQEPGFYWARSNIRFEWYNLIVEVYGNSPFFKIRSWNRISNKLYLDYELSLYDIAEFGPKIEEPKVPIEDIKKE